MQDKQLEYCVDNTCALWRGLAALQEWSHFISHISSLLQVIHTIPKHTAIYIYIYVCVHVYVLYGAVTMVLLRCVDPSTEWCLLTRQLDSESPNYKVCLCTYTIKSLPLY